MLAKTFTESTGLLCDKKLKSFSHLHLPALVYSYANMAGALVSPSQIDMSETFVRTVPD